MKRNKLLMWDTSVDALLNNKQFGGIAVQLFFWGQIFSLHHWEVHSITYEKSHIQNDIHFHRIPQIKYIDLILEWFTTLYLILKIHPQIIIIRGAQRRILPLTVYTRLINYKLVYFGASDVNFVPGKELCGKAINKKMYQLSVTLSKYIVTQNAFQTKTLWQNYHKHAIQISNIWGHIPLLNNTPSRKSQFDIVWIGNFRKLKRPEWFIRVSKLMPQYSFAIAGRPSNDLDYFLKMQQTMEENINGHFLGGIPFSESNVLIQKAKLLVCTSTFEGFPNTFLQAWSYNIPVVSTVDPDNVITSHYLGIHIHSETDLFEAILLLMENEKIYKAIQYNITSYFMNNHSPETNYKKLMAYLEND